MTIVDLPIADLVVDPDYQRDPQPTYGDLRSEREKEIDAEVKARVLAGIALLEEKYGPDWASQIDLDTFDLRVADSCVLGQLYAEEAEEEGMNGYDWGCANLLDGDWGHDYGFYHDAVRGGLVGQPTGKASATWDALDDEWKRAIAERR